MCDGHFPADASARSGATVVSWPLAKANGFILVWESLTGIIPVRLLRSQGGQLFVANKKTK
jgi:hypothetical protein